MKDLVELHGDYDSAVLCSVVHQACRAPLVGPTASQSLRPEERHLLDCLSTRSFDYCN